MTARILVVVPCYNEEDRLDCSAFRAFAERNTDCGFLFVNDGSTDNTGELLRELCRSNSAFLLHELPRNCGKAEAVRQGMLKAMEFKPAYIGMWDADLAAPLEAIPQFAAILDAKSEIDVLIGARVKLLGRNIKRKGFRHVLGRLSATIISIVLGVPVYDTQCGAKFFRVTELTGSLFEEPFVSSWIFDVEILSRLIKAHRLGFSCSPEKTVWEAPLDQWVHKDGSKIEISDYFTALYELFKIRRKYFKSGD